MEIIYNHPFVAFILVVVTIISAVIACWSAYYAKKTKDASDTANELTNIAININDYSNKLIERQLSAAEKSRHDEKRPDFELTTLQIPHTEYEIYSGELSGVNEGNLIPTFDKQEIIKTNLNQISRFSYKGRECLCINIIENNTDESEILSRGVLGVNTLHVGFKFSEKISTIELDAGYTLRGSTALSNKLILDAKFELEANQTTLDIYYAYACIEGGLKITDMRNLYNLKNEMKTKNIKEPINLFKPDVNIVPYLGLDETAYLIRCDTIDNDTYYYSLFLKRDVNNNKVELAKIHYGSKFFEQKAKKARGNSDIEIVQYSNNYLKRLKEQNEESSYKNVPHLFH